VQVRGAENVDEEKDGREKEKEEMMYWRVGGILDESRGREETKDWW
jgi:hypothetical protein